MKRNKRFFFSLVFLFVIVLILLSCGNPVRDHYQEKFLHKCVELTDHSGRTGVYIDYNGSHVIRLTSTGKLVIAPYATGFIVIHCTPDMAG